MSYTMGVTDVVTDSDEDPVDLAQALDAVLDAADAAMEADGYEGQGRDLVTAAQATADMLIAALGGVDADEVAPVRAARRKLQARRLPPR